MTERDAERPGRADATSVRAALVPKPASARPLPEARAPAQSHAYVIAAIGDSLTDRRANGGKYLDYVKERCPETRIDNYGKGGDMVNQMRRRFTRDISGDGPDASAAKTAYTHLIVFGGVNDLYSDLSAGRTPAKIAADLSFIYDAARARKMKVVGITVAPWAGFTRYYNARRGESTRRLNAWIIEQKPAQKIDYVVDAHALLSCGDPERLCERYEMSSRDGLHPGPAGHRKLGEALYDSVFRDCR